MARRKKTLAQWGREKAAANNAVKIGRPRTAKEIRISRGVRLDPALIARADSAVEVGYAGVSNFTQVVECALTDWLHQFDKSASGSVSRAARAK